MFEKSINRLNVLSRDFMVNLIEEKTLPSQKLAAKKNSYKEQKSMSTMTAMDIIDDAYNKPEDDEQSDLQAEIRDLELKSTENKNQEKEKKADINDCKSSIQQTEGKITDLNNQLSSLAKPEECNYKRINPKTGKPETNNEAYQAALYAYRQEKNRLEQELQAAKRELDNLKRELSSDETELSKIQGEGQSIEADLAKAKAEQNNSGREKEQPSAKTPKSNKNNSEDEGNEDNRAEEKAKIELRNEIKENKEEIKSDAEEVFETMLEEGKNNIDVMPISKKTKTAQEEKLADIVESASIEKKQINVDKMKKVVLTAEDMQADSSEKQGRSIEASEKTENFNNMNQASEKAENSKEEDKDAPDDEIDMNEVKKYLDKSGKSEKEQEDIVKKLEKLYGDEMPVTVAEKLTSEDNIDAIIEMSELGVTGEEITDLCNDKVAGNLLEEYADICKEREKAKLDKLTAEDYIAFVNEVEGIAEVSTEDAVELLKSMSAEDAVEICTDPACQPIIKQIAILSRAGLSISEIKAICHNPKCLENIDSIVTLVSQFGFSAADIMQICNSPEALNNLGILLQLQKNGLSMHDIMTLIKNPNCKGNLNNIMQLVSMGKNLSEIVEIINNPNCRKAMKHVIKLIEQGKTTTEITKMLKSHNSLTHLDALTQIAASGKNSDDINDIFNDAKCMNKLTSVKKLSEMSIGSKNIIRLINMDETEKDNVSEKDNASEKDKVSETNDGKDYREDFYNSIISEKINNNIFSSAINAALDVNTSSSSNEKAKNNLLLYRRYIKM